MTSRRTTPTLLSAAALCAAAPLAEAQFQFSIDHQGPTISVPDFAWGAPITEGDILYPSTSTAYPMLGPLPVPSIERNAGPGGPVPIDLGLFGYAPCAGHAPGIPCTVEVDALSHGLDNLMDPAFPYPVAGMLRFSVDEYSRGIPVTMPGPNVVTESPFGESAADVFTDIGTAPGPLPPGGYPMGHVGVVDGDGMMSPSGFVYPGVGIKEPTMPTFMPGPSTGDNLDALDEETPHGFYPAFFSLEGALIDPLSGIPGSGSAAFHGFSSADVLATFAPGALPFPWAPAGALGLDLMGPNSDDLDALIIWENGTGVYEGPIAPYSWTTGAHDMVLFSVSRGSAVVGMPDSLLGLPIEPGDILMPPVPGGLSPFPGILYAAENLGLATMRGGFGNVGDELDAADARFYPPNDCDGDGIDDAAAIAMGIVTDCNGNGIPDVCESGDCDGDGILDVCELASGTASDCNMNGVPDDCDIANGTSTDFNADGVPDECGPGTVTCVGDGSLIPCPCGNESALGAEEGCLNSVGTGGILYTTGTSVVAFDNLTFHAAQCRPGMPALLVQGSSFISIPFKDGVFCTGGPTQRVEVILLDAAGNGSTSGSIVTGGSIPAVGGTRWYQMWYRDPGGSPCLTGSNFTRGLEILWI